MNVRKILKTQIQRFILANEENLSKSQIYSAVAEHFGLDRKRISQYYLQLQAKGLLNAAVDSIPPSNYTDQEVKKIFSQSGDDLTISLNLDYEIKTLEQLVEACEVDTTKWEVTSWQCGKRNIHSRNAEKQLVLTPLFTVRACFKPITVDTSLELQRDVILKELFTAAPSVAEHTYKIPRERPDEYLFEIALFDVHFGKLAHREECGEDYDLKIAVKRYRESVAALLSRVDTSTVDRILLPIGNDMVTIDNMAGLTTSGTPQDTDSRFYKIVRAVKNLLIETIDSLVLIAPVDVVVCVGNHDQQTSFMIGEMLQAYYHNHPTVTINNSASLRKYYHFGETGILFTHGNKEKHSSLGMIFAAENPQLWAATTQRFIQIGHYHHNKKIDYLSHEEMQGFQIQIIPSICPKDAWHTGKGYSSLRQAKAFLYGKKGGLLAEYTHTI